MIFRSIKYTFFILILTSMFSCGKTDEQKVKDGIETANYLLSTRQCQPAIDLLEGLGRQTKNARYLKALSTAYACRADYSTITLFGSDIALTASPAPLGGMTRYSSSLVTFTSPLTSDSKFSDLREAINILLYAGGFSTATEPTSVERAKYFSTTQSGEINTQLAFMMLVQLGRFMKVYADTDTAGVKGGGPASNLCLTDYSTINGAVQGVLTAQLGACTVQNSPHAQLNSASITVAERRKRLCEGIVLINGIVDLLPAILANAGGGSLGNISTVTTDIATAKTALTSVYAAGEVLTVLSQYNCENSSGITTQTLESYYATMGEALVR